MLTSSNKSLTHLLGKDLWFSEFKEADFLVFVVQVKDSGRSLMSHLLIFSLTLTVVCLLVCFILSKLELLFKPERAG